MSRPYDDGAGVLTGVGVGVLTGVGVDVGVGFWVGVGVRTGSAEGVFVIVAGTVAEAVTPPAAVGVTADGDGVRPFGDGVEEEPTVCVGELVGSAGFFDFLQEVNKKTEMKTVNKLSRQSLPIFFFMRWFPLNMLYVRQFQVCAIVLSFVSVSSKRAVSLIPNTG